MRASSAAGALSAFFLLFLVFLNGRGAPRDTRPSEWLPTTRLQDFASTPLVTHIVADVAAKTARLHGKTTSAWLEEFVPWVEVRASTDLIPIKPDRSAYNAPIADPSSYDPACSYHTDGDAVKGIVRAIVSLGHGCLLYTEGAYTCMHMIM